MLCTSYVNCYSFVEYIIKVFEDKSFSRQEMKDAVDSGIGVKDIIFDSEHNERRSWVFFGQNVARSQVVFIVQVLIVLLIAVASVVNITLAAACEDKSFWIALLSSSIGYMLPPPHL